MSIEYSGIRVRADGQRLRIDLTLQGAPADAHLGWQLFDPETDQFIREGQWVTLPFGAAGGRTPAAVELDFPPEPGGYRLYVSPITETEGWAYARGESFLIVDAEMVAEHIEVRRTEVTTLRKLRWRAIGRGLPKIFEVPVLTIVRNQRLIRSMVRRDILARYRGSAGDVLWTVLNPLLLMSTYFFVFGVVLGTRFGPDQSSTGFVLYFLAGMLPWLAFSEPAGRAPHVVLEHRNFVKKLIFPLETLPVNQVVSGFVTELFALGVFLVLLLVFRGSIPATVLWLPVLLVPQVLFTLGVCWFLAGLGAFLRDLGQVMGFLLTLWFFITPICYPETKLTGLTLAILGKNPMFVLVRGYRSIFLEHSAPEFGPLWKLWVVAVLAFLVGHAWFYKLRKSFADVI